MDFMIILALISFWGFTAVFFILFSGLNAPHYRCESRNPLKTEWMKTPPVLWVRYLVNEGSEENGQGGSCWQEAISFLSIKALYKQWDGPWIQHGAGNAALEILVHADRVSFVSLSRLWHLNNAHLVWPNVQHENYTATRGLNTFLHNMQSFQFARTACTCTHTPTHSGDIQF